MHAGGLLASSQTTASWVSELSDDRALHWATGTSAPCTSIFKPFRVDEPVDLGRTPDDRFDERTLWWRHECLHRWALRDPAMALPLFSEERDDVERRWLGDPPESAPAAAEAEALLARWTASVATAVSDDHRPLWARCYWRTREDRAGLGARERPESPVGQFS
jgi:dipeptidase